MLQTKNERKKVQSNWTLIARSKFKTIGHLKIARGIFGGRMAPIVGSWKAFKLWATEELVSGGKASFHGKASRARPTIARSSSPLHVPSPSSSEHSIVCLASTEYVPFRDVDQSNSDSACERSKLQSALGVSIESSDVTDRCKVTNEDYSRRSVLWTDPGIILDKCQNFEDSARKQSLGLTVKWIIQSANWVIAKRKMVTGVGATMPNGGVTVGATPPAQHVPPEAGQPPAQTTTTTTTTTTRRSGENRRVSGVSCTINFKSVAVFFWNFNTHIRVRDKMPLSSVHWMIFFKTNLW